MCRPTLSSFSQACTAYAGREGVKNIRLFFFSKMSFMVYCDLEKGVSRSTFAKYSFGRKEGGHKKAYSQSVYALDNVDNAG